jgi:hypothetical protein
METLVLKNFYEFKASIPIIWKINILEKESVHIHSVSSSTFAKMKRIKYLHRRKEFLRLETELNGV